MCSTSPSLSWSLHPLYLNSTAMHQNHTATSEFRLLNRRTLIECPNPSPFLQIDVSPDSSLSDEEYLRVTVTGVLNPSGRDWVAMISPANSNVESCPLSGLLYAQTGDLSELPLLCHYPVKAMYMNKDPDYLRCKKKQCKKYSQGKCAVTTCSGTLTFHVINIRTEVAFVLFRGGFETPCILSRSNPISFANPKKPLYGHISSKDSTGTSVNDNVFSIRRFISPKVDHLAMAQCVLVSIMRLLNMRLTWVSGDKEPQQVQYGDEKTETSEVTTFAQDEMCSSVLPSPAKDYGWHDPGYIHSAPGSLSVIKAMAEEVESNKIDSIFHIGDISYATGFLVEWDFFLHQISPVASRVSYMTAIGNHERDYIGSGSRYQLTDSGGECGIPYETYFPMPTPAKDKPWYSIEQASVHFTVMSTEHDWSVKSEQNEWMKKDMASVDRSKTPWLIFMGLTRVDLVLFGHVHNYERTCSVYQKECKAVPTKDKNGIDIYDHSNYSAPVHAVIGMAGFTLDKFPNDVESWSLSRISQFGYARGHATKEELKLEFVNSDTKKVKDSFRIIKTQPSS
ncbi:putative inactive purple acid phosphatase 27 [Morella rubra]|uniref:Putative inactive purple acid phosphatase 27 n=1 Tax=Morella rubra TaxID=262757 RepID=A0A6A1WI13_9ROSI|nr:putative inactive purple acid phosphatase 27 [Morella rubra]